MDKSKKIGAQIYGYMVCLVAVITFLLSVTALVSSVNNLRDPLHSGWNPAGTPSLASFENYKMDILRSSQKNDEITKTSYIPDDKTLMAMYEAAKTDKIKSVEHQSNGSVFVSGLLICICIVLFITHWRWMKKISRYEAD